MQPIPVSMPHLFSPLRQHGVPTPVFGQNAGLHPVVVPASMQEVPSGVQHLPRLHTRLPGQTFPQAPQLSASLSVVTHRAPQTR
jgi:hypothetical protein